MSSPGQHMSDLSGSNKGISISSEIMVAAIVFFFMVVVFVFFLHLYAKRRWGPYSASASRRSRLVFAGNQDPPAATRRGLDPAIIISLPVSVYHSDKDSKDAAGGIECAVCLSELADGEKVRLLPGCNHAFHLECIDMWFHSHSTCPLCRRPVGPDHPDPDVAVAVLLEDQIPTDEYTTESSPNLPTNVLFWGTQDQVSTTAAASQESASTPPPSSSSREGHLVIEIPRRAAVAEGFSSSSPLPSSRFPADLEMKSPAAAAAAAAASTTTPMRLRSLRRLLIREPRVVVGPSSSPRGGGGDIEQGGCGGVAPKTPTGGS